MIPVYGNCVKIQLWIIHEQSYLNSSKLNSDGIFLQPRACCFILICEWGSIAFLGQYAIRFLINHSSAVVCNWWWYKGHDIFQLHIPCVNSQLPEALFLSWINFNSYMLNCFKDYKICIHISYHSLDFVKQKKTKFIMEQPYMLPILYCQYHVCWCPGDLWSQGISRHGIDQRSRNIPSLASEELITSWILNK